MGSCIRKPPKESRDLMIAAVNSHVMAFDNLSSLPSWLSDDLCSLATGGGFSTRTLYSDSEEQIFDATKPVILGGIEDFVRAGDLLDRSILIRLEAIKEEDRKTESELWKRFDSAHPELLGALFSRVADGLRHRDEVKLTKVPRMADFVTFAVACEGVHSDTDSVFYEAYTQNRSNAGEQAIEDSTIAAAVIRFMEHRTTEWKSTASELFEELKSFAPPDPKPKDWPTKPSYLSGKLLRLAPNLRRVHGIHFSTGRENGGQRTRYVRLIKGEGQHSPEEGRDRDGCRPYDEPKSNPYPETPCDNGRGSRDGRDGKSRAIPGDEVRKAVRYGSPPRNGTAEKGVKS